MSLKRVVIIANGDLGDLNFHRNLLKADDYIISVNGGTAHALSLGFEPTLIVGDLDSLSSEQKAELSNLGSDLARHSTEKEKSDLELALDRAIGMKPAEILIIGALGGQRTDHALINLLLLKMPLDAGIPASIVDENQEIYLTRDRITINGEPGDYLSLFPLGEEAGGIVTENLKYPLNKETLHFASTRGLSNELIAGSATVRVRSGLLLLIKTKQEAV